MKRKAATLCPDVVAVHGEGPVWDEAYGRLIWVGLTEGKLHAPGSLGAPGMWPECICLHRRGLIRTDRIVTHRLSLADFAEAIETSRTRRDGAIKFLLTP